MKRKPAKLTGRRYTTVEALMKGEGVSKKVRDRVKELTAQKPTLYDLVKVAHRSGEKVSVSLEPKEMPARFPNDPEPVKLLIEESERMSKLGNNWLTAEIPNQVAAEMCLRHGWAFALAAAWMRCKLKGELLPESESQKTRTKS